MPPILANKDFDAESVFAPENLLRESCRQKGIVPSNVPAVCVLDPDGDLARRLTETGRAARDPSWACYHTELLRTNDGGFELGIVGRAVGAPFAVLVAEQLFASGCRLLLSVTSAGQLQRKRPPPYFVLIDRALRDEGTSYHYLPAAEFSDADPELLDLAERSLAELDVPIDRGATWTTDAPYRETGSAIQAMENLGLLAVEMEAAALYAFAKRATNPSSASPMSPIRWPAQKVNSRREMTTESPRFSQFSEQLATTYR